MFRHQFQRGYLAVALFILTASGAAGFDHTPKGAEDPQRQRQSTMIDANAEQEAPIRGDVIRLEDSLQWTGRDAVELPVSLFVTDLLPGNC
ncbi:MAG: hypothetical protein ACN4GT_01455 [Gammaproteobacteria bacterium]